MMSLTIFEFQLFAGVPVGTNIRPTSGIERHSFDGIQKFCETMPKTTYVRRSYRECLDFRRSKDASTFASPPCFNVLQLLALFSFVKLFLFSDCDDAVELNLNLKGVNLESNLALLYDSVQFSSTIHFNPHI
jgi:hypothetical protein